MEEKERYKLESHNGTFCDFHDTETDKWYTRKDLVTDLLNQQDKEIKKLCQQIIDLNKENNKLRKFRDDILRVQAEPYQFYKENQQLKQQLAESKEQLIAMNEKSNKIKKESYYLKQQLAKKDKEIDERIMTFEKRCQEYYKSKEFTIEQLEKVKENIKNCPITDYDFSGNFEKMYKQDAIRQIDNQIKQLKEKINNAR